MKNIIKQIVNIADQHISLRSAKEGDILTVAVEPNILYPCFSIDIVNSELSTNVNTHNFRLYAFDRVENDNSNAIDIQSDMFKILEDIIRSLGVDSDYIVTTTPFNPFIQKFDDYCAGYYTDITVEIKSEYNNCDNPVDLNNPDIPVDLGDLIDYSILAQINKNIEQDLRLDNLDNDFYFSNSLAEEALALANTKEDIGVAQSLDDQHLLDFNHNLIATALQSETDPIFSASPAFSIDNTDLTNINNLSGTNTGDQVGDGITITGSGTALDPFVSNSDSSKWEDADSSQIQPKEGKHIDASIIDNLPSPILDHNDLTNIQGGTTAQYYHLTNNELTDLQASRGTFDTFTDFPTIGSVKVLYFAIDIKTFYTWSGTAYIPVNFDAQPGSFTTDFTSGTGWNASTNTPTVISYTGNVGDFAIVSVAGTTNINGINSWSAGDYIWWDADNHQWQKVDNQIASPPTLPPLTTDKVWLGVANVATEVDTIISSLSISDYTGSFAGLATASNWTNNICSAVAGVIGDRAIGIDELGSISESFYTQYGWARDFINSFITDVTQIAALETTGNWTKVSDLIWYYNAAKGDRGQTYYNNGIFYFCLGNASHTWIKYGTLTTVTAPDAIYMPTPQVEVGKADNSTFVIVAKYDITNIIVEAETTTAGNISIGSADGLSDIVPSTALPTTIGNKIRLDYLIDVNYPTAANRTFYINISSTATVKLHLITQKMIP